MRYVDWFASAAAALLLSTTASAVTFSERPTTSGLDSAGVAAGAHASIADGPRPSFDAARLRTGRFAYHTSLAGKDAGDSMISVTRLDSRTYRFRNEVTGTFRQTWESSSTAALEPLAATLGLGAEDDKRRTMRLVYEGRSVRGTATRGAQTDAVSAEVPPDVVDQRVDWAALMALPLGAARAPRFTVYDPWTGTSPLAAEIGAAEAVHVSAGTFTVLRITYAIEKAGRVERYVIWVTESTPRFLVREDFPNGATTELVSVAP